MLIGDDAFRLVAGDGEQQFLLPAREVVEQLAFIARTSFCSTPCRDPALPPTVGRNFCGFAVGDRVAWVRVFGSYAEKIVLAADLAVPVPDDVPSDVAAALMMQGVTAHHFVTESAPLAAGETALVHSAAGESAGWSPSC
ncbi:hypothetical protein ACFQ9X_09105 [Catenulispora yoronensis]